MNVQCSEARQQGWEGTVTLHLELRADDTVGDVQVACSSGHEILDTAAQETAKTWKHTPVPSEGGSNALGRNQLDL